MNREKRNIWLKLSPFMVALFSTLQFVFYPAVAATPNPEKKMYIKYNVFKKLTGQCKKLDNPLLAGLTAAGHKLWEEGDLKVPETGNVVRGDFNKNGNENISFVVRDGKSNFLLVSEKNRGNWQNQGLIKIKSAKLPIWNGKALKIGSKSFVAWSGGRFRETSGALALYQYGYDLPDYRGVMIKLTYIGPQNQPYPGLLIHSYYRVPDMKAFKKFRKKGIDYGNDDMKVLWTLTLPVKKVYNMVSTIASSNLLAKAEDRNPLKIPVHHSLTIIDTASGHRPNNYQLFLKGEETVKLLKQCAVKINNSDAAGLIKEYNTMFGG